MCRAPQSSVWIRDLDLSINHWACSLGCRWWIYRGFDTASNDSMTPARGPFVISFDR